MNCPVRGTWSLGRNKSRNAADMFWLLTFAKASAVERTKERQMRFKKKPPLISHQAIYSIYYPILTKVMSNIKSISGHICCHGNDIFPGDPVEIKGHTSLPSFTNMIYFIQTLLIFRVYFTKLRSHIFSLNGSSRLALNSQGLWIRIITQH